VADAINRDGDAVGYFIDSNHAFFHASLWSGGSMTDLGTLGGGTNSQANAINASGQIVGWSDTLTGLEDATLWINGQIVDLNTVLSPAMANTFLLTSATGINDKGQIVTIANNTQTNQNHIFLLSPPGCSDSKSEGKHERRSHHHGNDENRHEDRNDDDHGCCREHHGDDGKENTHCEDHRD
jgi:probable HAF family extracellular repeat protein